MRNSSSENESEEEEDDYDEVGEMKAKFDRILQGYSSNYREDTNKELARNPLSNALQAQDQ